MPARVSRNPWRTTAIRTFSTGGAQGHANPHLARALRRAKRNHSVNTDGGKRQTQHSHDSGERGSETKHEQATQAVNPLLHGAGVKHRKIGRKLMDLVLHGQKQTFRSDGGSDLQRKKRSEVLREWEIKIGLRVG